QAFTISVNDAVQPGATVSNVGTVGFVIDYSAVGVTGSYVFGATSDCVRLVVPYDPSLLQRIPASARASLTIYQVVPMAKRQLAFSAVTGPVQIDTANSTLSFCAAHVTQFGAAADLHCKPVDLAVSLRSSGPATNHAETTLASPIVWQVPALM